MLIGAMNHPAVPIQDEIREIARMGFDFIDLTLEPPLAASWQVEPAEVRDVLESTRLDAVGHTAYYLPIASSFESLRQGAIMELARCIEVFAAMGVSSMNVHPDTHAPMQSRQFLVDNNILSLRELLLIAEDHDMNLMMENLPGAFNSAAQLGEILDPLPALGLHLDIGHANLRTPYNTTAEILCKYGDRLQHVHLHDNRGGVEDLHLPLGTGTLDWKAALGALRACGYDGTISLEVFSSDRKYLTWSRDQLRQAWDG